MPTVEQARETKAGPALTELFFKVCWNAVSQQEMRYGSMTDVWIIPGASLPWLVLPKVDRDANACEAWAMRWAREQGLRSMIEEQANGEWVAVLYVFDCDGEFVDSCECRGSDWKAAFVRACIVAAEAMKLNAKGT